MTVHGVWIDDPAASLRKPAYWNLIAEHGFRTAALMLETSETGFDPKYSLDDLRAARSMAFDRDIEIALTVWCEPNPKWIAEFKKNIGGYLKASGASALENDAEHNWHRERVKGFANLDKAGDALVEAWDAVSADNDVRIEATTFTFHTENSERADIAPHAHRLLPQGYSVRNRSEGVIEIDGAYGPGRMQKLTFDRAKAICAKPGGPRLSCGLAAYDQVWPNVLPEDAMQIAYDAAMAYDPIEIRYWSSKWIFGNRKNGYASRFFKRLVERAK